jgi:GTP pyrophosphokinase
VHKSECDQLAHLLRQHPERAIEVNWSGANDSGFSAQISLKCLDRTGLMRDITTLTSNDKVPVLAINSQSHQHNGTCQIDITIEVKNLSALQQLIKKLRAIDGVQDAYKKEH